MQFYAIILVFVCFIGCGQATKMDKRTLHIKEIDSSEEVDVATVSKLLEEQAELHSIDIINWDTFRYKPEVKFRIAHANNQIWLKYYIKEENVLAQVDTINGDVAGDSCVEFFFDPRADGNYYNFEFSCIGMPHLAYGPGRHKREFVDEEKIKKQLAITSSLGNKTFTEKTGGHTWEMTIVIPASILVEDENIQLKGLKTRANFYKCGDKTSERHYLSWNDVGTETPDFHRPEYFGTLIFE